mgnify:CR=1 FL=1
MLTKQVLMTKLVLLFFLGSLHTGLQRRQRRRREPHAGTGTGTGTERRQPW